ncbi:MAG TPA: transposase family protein [Streptosporangiaceae bacterium]
MRETVRLLAARAPKLRARWRRRTRPGTRSWCLMALLSPSTAWPLTGRSIPGRHRKHGMNLQVIASPDGEILWVSGALPGAAHDLTAARIWGIVHELAAAGLIVPADKGYSGAGDHLITPYRGRGKPASQKAANSTHAKLRAPAERANAQLKTWAVLRKLRCCPWHAGQLAKTMIFGRRGLVGGGSGHLGP